MNKFIGIGSSPLMESTCYAGVIAKQLGMKYVSLSRPVNTNQKICRKILSYPDYQPGDFVLIEWTSTIRYEFRTEHGWTNTNPNSYRKGTGSFEEYFYEKGPGQWEYSGIHTVLKEMIIAETFLKSKKIDYLYIFFHDDIAQSILWQDPLCEYLRALKQLIDQSKIVTFDGHGADHWFRINQCEYFDSTHPAASAHQQLAQHMLDNCEIIKKLSASRDSTAS
jgi:hypothetical protein